MRRGGVAALSLLLLPWGRAALGQASPECRGPGEIERALTKQPSAEAYNALGAWFAQRDRTACAIPAFRSAIRLRPNDWEGHFNLALALMNERHFKDAAGELRQADKLSPGRAPVHTALGMALQEAGQTAAAETELKTALELDPKSIRALDRLAQILTGQKRYTAAIRYLKQAIALDSKDPNLRIALALNYSENGNAAAAY